MAVDAVFISSVMTGFEDIREQAALAVERMGMHPIRAERQPAKPDASRQAMFGAIAQSDYYLLLMGERYGEPGESGKSPTEEEFEEADKLNRPALVLVQQGITMESEQLAFLERVRGTWGEGVFHDRFTSPDDVALAVAAALNAQVTVGADDIPGAQARAAELSRGEQRTSSSGGVAVRVGLVPVREVTLLDAVTLERPELDTRLAETARRARLIPQSVGINMTMSAAGIHLVGKDTDNWTIPEVSVGADGSILAITSVRGDGPLAGSLIDPQRLEHALIATGRFALETWSRIDADGQISRVAISVAFPEAQHKALGSASGSSMSIPQNLPPTVVAPEPALVVARGQVNDDDTINRLLAEIRSVFRDAGALQ